MFGLIVAGGELVLSGRVLAAARDADIVIAVDSGARHLDALHREADLLLGDFDSYLPEAPTCEVIRFPAAKDASDTQLGVREALRRGANRIVLLAALRGPRLDHGVANLLLLTSRELRGIDLRAIDGADELRAVRTRAEVDGRPGDLVTLLAATQRVAGVSTEGLAFALRRGWLKRGDSRGLSNVMTAERAVISVERGVLLLVHRDGGDPNALYGPAVGGGWLSDCPSRAAL